MTSRVIHSTAAAVHDALLLLFPVASNMGVILRTGQNSADNLSIAPEGNQALFSISGPLLQTLPTDRFAGVMRIPSDS